MDKEELGAALIVEKNLEHLVETSMAEIDAAATGDEALNALSNLNLTLAFAASRRPAILVKLGKFAGRLKAATEAVATRTGADSFSLSVGLPSGINVELTWNTLKHQVVTDSLVSSLEDERTPPPA